jgi:DNA polymerase-3 subunit epsilon
LIAQLEGTILVAHAAWIERSFLDRAMKKQKTRVGPAVIDTAGLSRALGITPFSPGREPSTEYLAGKLNLFAHTPHHALGDALTTAELFLALATHLEQRTKRGGLLSLTVADLVRYSAA